MTTDVTWLDTPGSALAGPTDAIDFVAVAPDANTLWTTLYEVDFRTLASALIGQGHPVNAPPSGNANLCTIDGLPWRMHTPGPLSDPWAISLINGTGLRIVTNQSSTDYAGIYLAALYTSFTGYDPAKWTAVQVRGEVLGLSGLNHIFGASSWNGPLTYGSPGSTAGIGNLRANHQASSIRAAEPRTGITWPGYTPHTGSSGDWAFAVADSPSGGRKSAFYGAFSGGALPPMEEMVPLGSYADTSSATRSLGIYAGGTFATPIQVDVTHFRLLQRAAIGAAP